MTWPCQRSSRYIRRILRIWICVTHAF